MPGIQIFPGVYIYAWKDTCTCNLHSVDTPTPNLKSQPQTREPGTHTYLPLHLSRPQMPMLTQQQTQTSAQFWPRFRPGLIGVSWSLGMVAMTIMMMLFVFFLLGI